MFDDAIRAMRNEVTGDILDAKHQYFEQHSGSDGRIPCRLTGKLMTVDQSG
jgi:hypothetical protein